MIENVTIGQVGVLVAFIVALVKGIDAIANWFKKPAENVEQKISNRLDQMEKDNKMMLKVLYSLLQHEVTGDHSNDMESLYREVSNYILEK